MSASYNVCLCQREEQLRQREKQLQREQQQQRQREEEERGREEQERQRAAHLKKETQAGSRSPSLKSTIKSRVSRANLDLLNMICSIRWQINHRASSYILHLTASGLVCDIV